MYEEQTTMFKTILQYVLTFTAAMGGGAIIIAVFAQWFGKIWADRLVQNAKAKLDMDVESHKVRLRKSEILSFNC